MTKDNLIEEQLQKMKEEDMERLVEKHKKNNKRNRHLAEVKRLKEKRKKTCYRYTGSGVVIKRDENNKPYYKHFHTSKKYHRRVSNKMVRRYKGKIENGSHYKKIYDLWWILL